MFVATRLQPSQNALPEENLRTTDSVLAAVQLVRVAMQFHNVRLCVVIIRIHLRYRSELWKEF